MIPNKQQLQSKRYRLIDGVWHKLCSGSAHEEPEWLPLTSKYYYFRKANGRPLANCRLCHVWDKVKNPGSHHGYVDIRVARPFYQEAVNRIGMQELVRRSGLSMHQVQQVFLSSTRKYVQKASLRKVMLELVSIHRKNEYNSDPRVRWQTERRNNGELGRCSGCGGPVENITRGCIVCRNRWYDRYRHGKISKKKWEEIKEQLNPSRINTRYLKL